MKNTIKIKRINTDRRYVLEEKMSQLLVYCSIILPIFMGMPVVPSVVKYTADVLWIGAVLCTVIRGRVRFGRNILPLAVTVVLLFSYALLVYFARFQSWFYFLWGIRNLFRFYIAFFMYVYTMEGSVVEKWFSFLEKIFWINAVLSFIQFVFMGVKGDFLGGVFGIEGGTNGFTLALLCVVVTRSLLVNFEKKGNVNSSLLVCIVALGVAAMAELKVFFVLFVIILVYAAIITKFSIRNLVVLVIGIICAVIGAQLLTVWFGFEGFFTLDGIVELAIRDSYANSSADDINRMSAISSLNNRTLHTVWDRLFGLGLGNCDTSSFEIFNSTFYKQNASMHYTWFTAPMLYLETGYLGLAIYFAFFVICFGLALKRYLRGAGNKIYCQMAMIMAVICCILAFYNASLRYEIAYMLYFVLALPFIRKSETTATETARETPENVVTSAEATREIAQ